MQKTLTSDEEKFIAMLEQAQVRASAQWPAVAEHFAPDPRFTAVPKESRFVLFRSYIRMQQDMNALKLDDTEREYMVCFGHLSHERALSGNSLCVCWQLLYKLNCCTNRTSAFPVSACRLVPAKCLLHRFRACHLH